MLIVLLIGDVASDGKSNDSATPSDGDNTNVSDNAPPIADTTEPEAEPQTEPAPDNAGTTPEKRTFDEVFKDATFFEEIPSKIPTDALETDIAAALPDEYKNSDWYDLSCDHDGSGGITVYLQIDQGNDNSDAALHLAADCYNISKAVTDKKGVTIELLSVTVVANNGAGGG